MIGYFVSDFQQCIIMLKKNIGVVINKNSFISRKRAILFLKIFEKEKRRYMKQIISNNFLTYLLFKHNIL